MAIGPEEYFFLQSTPPAARRKAPIRHVDHNLNLTESDFTAYHTSLFAVWMGSPSTRRAQWARRLWRFRGGNIDPGGLQGGIARDTGTALPEWADSLNAFVAARWRTRTAWRNRSHLSDFTWLPALVRVLVPSWIPFSTPQHIKAFRLRAQHRARLAGDYNGQEFLPIIVPVLEPTVPLGMMRITGGGMTL